MLLSLPHDLLAWFFAQYLRAADRYVLRHVCRTLRHRLANEFTNTHDASYALYKRYAVDNRIAMLDWLYRVQRVSIARNCYPSLCSHAALHGALDALRFTHERGCKWDADTCARAARAGSLDCLRYAREHGCQWDVDTCAFAARAGSLECLRYARANACPWDRRVLLYAAASLHAPQNALRRAQYLAVIEYARAHGAPEPQ